MLTGRSRHGRPERDLQSGRMGRALPGADMPRVGGAFHISLNPRPPYGDSYRQLRDDRVNSRISKARTAAC